MQLSNIINRQTVSAGIVATGVSIATFTIGLWDREKSIVANDTRLITTIENTLKSQQREIDNLSKQIADTRQEFVTDGSRNNKIDIARLQDRLTELANKIDNIPIGLGGSVNKKALDNAVQAAENRLTQRFSVQIGGLIDGAVSKALENQLPSIDTNPNRTIAIATTRNIHEIKKECAHLPSLGKSFTIKVKEGSELCINPSQLYARVNKIYSGSNGIEFFIPTYGKYRCTTNMQRNNKCIIGSPKVPKNYLLYTERIYEELGKVYSEIRLQEIPK